MSGEGGGGQSILGYNVWGARGGGGGGPGTIYPRIGCPGGGGTKYTAPDMVQ